MEGCKIVDILGVTEPDGTLYVTEVGNKVPFDIKRVFWVKDVAEGATRGDHATKKTKLILIPVAGSCEVVVDNGKEQEVFLMDSPKKGLYIDEMIWRQMRKFSKDCVMMALCDRPFEPGNETYDDYEEYKKALNE
ncbi:MAG: FdtA/QdtA family cupin domain-containing protein [Lachnospiraceae bacterium]|nr:FdtA/QdtA family cupin domain-containing protein [Lachnospiraceae bacterium]